MMDMKRYAMVAAPTDTVARYLPGNYSVAFATEFEGRDVTVIEGRDNSGWTMDGYVLPRLASGLYFGQEIGLDHPVFKTDAAAAG
jgi:hypothetical protein